jgi:hypothetical protein
MITVTSCEKAKEVDGKNGKVAIYKVGLSDGRFGESFGTQIPNGTPAEDIAIEESQWGLKFKLIKKNGFAGAGKARAGNESFALAYSKDLIVAYMDKLEKVPSSKELAGVVTAVADIFYSWLENKKK